ncbi:MAG: glycosyltransferase [Bacteroidetes bacterium]|nr:glycosyltransferase [Bacteroidota bacterium]
MYFPQFNIIGVPEILAIIALIGLLFIILYYCFSILPLARYKKPISQNENIEQEPVSVIICAKNEDDNLTEFLPKILTQNYPNFEVIIVNDCSTDNTENVIDEFSKIFPNLRKSNIKEDAYYKHGKKFAMLVGIKAAKNEKLVFTDADCYPASNTWLSEMVNAFGVDKQIVLNYGAYEKKKSFLNKLIRLDTFCIAANFLSAAIKGKAYMGVGRNLAYTKKLFYSVNGYKNHYHVSSGDDDLFVNETANRNNVAVCVSHNSITYSKPKTTFKLWCMQKARHLTTSPLYKGSTKTRLGLNYFAQYFFYLSLIPLFFTLETILLAPAILVSKIILQWIIFNKALKQLGEKDLLIACLFYEWILLVIYPIFHIYKLTYKPNKWTS